MAKSMRTEHLKLIAQHVYYGTLVDKGKGTDPVVFEDLPKDEKRKYTDEALRIVTMINAAGLDIARVEEDSIVVEARTREKLERIVRGVLKGITRPARVAEFFPVDELVSRIMQGREE
jgi:hypothetical protein